MISGTHIIRKRTRRPWRCMFAVAGLLLCFLPAQSRGQALTEREQAMLQRMEAMEKRIAELEKRLGVASNEALPAMEERIGKLEESAEEQEEHAEHAMHAEWKGGLSLSTEEGDFTLRLGGRVQNDFAWFDDDDSLRTAFGDQEDGTEFRREELYVRGTMFDDYEFWVECDFAGGDTDFYDLWIAANNIPHLGTLKIGHFKEPFGMERLMGASTLVFMERSQPSNVFAPGWNTGAQFSNTALNKRMTWAAGIFWNTDTYGNESADGGYNVSARVSGLPWYRKDGKHLLHLAAAYSHRNIDGPLRYRERPEAHLASVQYVDTGAIAVDGVDLYQLELAFLYGPLTFEAEYFASDADTVWVGGQHFGGYHAWLSFFLTRDSRPYDTGKGIFRGVKPNRPFSISHGGWGAWEVAARYSYIDLEDDFVLGGEESNWTAALNWYLNSQMRLMLNYVAADVDHVFYQGDINTLQLRVQTVF